MIKSLLVSFWVNILLSLNCPYFYFSLFCLSYSSPSSAARFSLSTCAFSSASSLLMLLLRLSPLSPTHYHWFMPWWCRLGCSTYCGGEGISGDAVWGSSCGSKILKQRQCDAPSPFSSPTPLTMISTALGSAASTSLFLNFGVCNIRRSGSSSSTVGGKRCVTRSTASNSIAVVEEMTCSITITMTKLQYLKLYCII